MSKKYIDQAVFRMIEKMLNPNNKTPDLEFIENLTRIVSLRRENSLKLKGIVEKVRELIDAIKSSKSGIRIMEQADNKEADNEYIQQARDNLSKTCDSLFF